jgi:Tfp pilus assembly protein PilE
MILKNFKNKKSGFVLLESILYICFFAILSILVINAILTMTKSFKETRVQSDLTRSSFVLEKITREIKKANSINSIGVGDLKLNTKDENGNSITVRFFKNNNDVQFFVNNALVDKLNADSVVVNSLSFSQITTTKGSAVRISMNVQSVNDALNRTVDFYDTIVLRGDY